MLSQEGKAKLQAVQYERKIIQAQVTEYVEQRLHELNECWENRIAQKVQKQMDTFAVALQKYEGLFAADASPSTRMASTPTTPCMNNCVSLPDTVDTLPPTNMVAPEQQEDHLEQDLLMQQATEDGIRQQLVVIEQRLKATVKTEFAAPPLLDLPQYEARVAAMLSARSSRNASQVSTPRTCLQFSPQRRISPEQRQQQLQQLRQKALHPQPVVRQASSIKREALPAADWRQTRLRRDGSSSSCSKRHPRHSRSRIS